MDVVLKQTGSCGRYQCLHVLLTQLPRFMAVFSILSLTFGGYDSGWRCRSGYGNNNTSSAQRLSVADVVLDMTSSDGYSSFSEENEDGRPEKMADKDHLTSGPFQTSCENFHNCSTIEFNPESRTVVSEFHLVCDRTWTFRMILLVQGCGFFLGPAVAGQIGERFGRKTGVFGCLAVLCVFTGISVFSTTWEMFAFCYFFIGGATNSLFGICPVYSMEFLNTKWRGYYGSFPTATVALCLFAIISLLLKNWVHLAIVTFVLSLISCLGFFLVVESPRWLATNGHTHRAEKALLKVAKFNGKVVEREQFLQFLDIAEQEKEEKVYTVKDLLRNRETRILVLKSSVLFLFLQTSVSTLIYGMNAIPGDYYMNIIQISCAEFVLTLTVGPLCNFLGRRTTICLISSINLACSATIIFVLWFSDQGKTQDLVVKVCAFFVKGASQSCSVAIAVFCTELFPTAVRNVAFGVLRCCAGAGALVIPFLTPAKDAESLMTCYSVMAACFLAMATMTLSLPETSRRELQDTLTGSAPSTRPDDDGDDDDGDDVDGPGKS